MVFLQMDSLYSLVVWHATSLKNDHWAFFCALLLILFLHIQGALHMKPRFCSGQVAFTIFFFSIYFSCAHEFPTGHHVPELPLVFLSRHIFRTESRVEQQPNAVNHLAEELKRSVI